MSTRLRLTLWNAGVLATIIVLYGVAVFAYVGTSLAHEADSALTRAARQLRAEILAMHDPQAAIDNGLIALPQFSLTTPSVYLQVVRGNASISARSQHLGSERLPVDVDMVAINMQGQAAFGTVSLDGGDRLRLYGLPIVVSDRVVGAVQAGYLLRDYDRAVQETGLTILVGGIVALAAAGGVGWGLSWLAMRPIDRIRDGVAQIAGTRDLAQRLPEPRVMDDVGRLVSTVNALLDRLAQVIDAQQRLGADVSHELRTPLTTIRGNVDLLRRGAADDPLERSIALDAIEAEVNRMSRLVADLLLVAQADAGMQLERQPVEMDTLLLQVYRQAQTMAAVGFAGSERVAIRLGHEDQAVVLGDPDRLRQLLLNLVDNALKYTPRGGTVTLSLHRATGWVRVTVQDTGTGISPDVLPHIFERFYRVPQLGRKGVGLGLAIARWIAGAHDGRLEVESEIGRGSTFTLWLPEASVMPV